MLDKNYLMIMIYEFCLKKIFKTVFKNVFIQKLHKPAMNIIFNFINYKSTNHKLFLSLYFRGFFLNGGV